MILTLEHFVDDCQKRINQLAVHYLEKKSAPSQLLQKAMSYSVLNGGKRVRPLLVYATGLLLDVPMEKLDAPASAVEFSHAYSLIHDDLPAMDDADLRRGQPACHKAFDEAIAILAGDALQTLAFEIIATHPVNLSAAQRIAMIKILAETSGPEGMAGGQALDLRSYPSSIEDLIRLYRLKTGALITACIKLAMCCAPDVDKKTQTSLEIFADNLGLAFQIQDDLLDVEVGTEILGKPQGLDAINNKKTYVSFAGVDATRQKIDELFETGINQIRTLGVDGNILESLATLLLKRAN